MKLSHFESWVSSVVGEIQKTMEILTSPLSDEPSQLVKQAGEIECQYARFLFLLAEADSFLNQAALASLPNRDGTELERKTKLKAALTPYQEFRDKIEGVGEAIKNRISLIQSILRYENHVNDMAPRFMEPSLRSAK